MQKQTHHSSTDCCSFWLLSLNSVVSAVSFFSSCFTIDSSCDISAFCSKIVAFSCLSLKMEHFLVVDKSDNYSSNKKKENYFSTKLLKSLHSSFNSAIWVLNVFTSTSDFSMWSLSLSSDAVSRDFSSMASCSHCF